MFTTADKALVAIVMGIAFLATTIFHIQIPGWLNEANVTQVLAVLTPILVYLIPNKPKTT
jgi:hypothetical protein